MSELAPMPIQPTPITVESGNALVRKLPVHEGNEGSKVLNDGDQDGNRKAVPFSLLLGSQMSEQGGFQRAITVDPKDLNRIRLSDDIRKGMMDETYPDGSTVSDHAVTLEQKGEGSEAQLWVRVGKRPVQFEEGNLTKQFLTEQDLANDALVISLEKSENAVAIVGFDPTKRRVIVEKVRAPRKLSTLGTPSIQMVSTQIEAATGTVDFPPITGDPLAKIIPEVLPKKVPPMDSIPDFTYYEPIVKKPLPPVPPLSEPPPYVDAWGVKDEKEAAPTPTYEITKMGGNKSTEATPEPKMVIDAEFKSHPDKELTRSHSEKLRQTKWSQAIGAAALAALLLQVPDSRGPQHPAVETPYVAPRPNFPEYEPPTIGHDLLGKSSWGAFLHDISRVDVNKVESLFPGGIPENVKEAWKAVRDAEEQAGEFLDESDPRIINADQAVKDFVGESNFKGLYFRYAGMLRSRTKYGSLAIGETKAKADDRLALQDVWDYPFTEDTAEVPSMEFVLRSYFIRQR